MSSIIERRNRALRADPSTNRPLTDLESEFEAWEDQRRGAGAGQSGDLFRTLLAIGALLAAIFVVVFWG